MCLIIETNTKAIVAEENIYCYKLLAKNNRSVVCNYQYQLGKLNIPVDIVPEVQRAAPAFYINEGYHSFKDKKGAVNDKGPREKIVLCVIPKGTKYWVGKVNQSYADGFVSENIVILGRVNHPVTWFRKLAWK